MDSLWHRNGIQVHISEDYFCRSPKYDFLIYGPFRDEANRRVVNVRIEVDRDLIFEVYRADVVRFDADRRHLYALFDHLSLGKADRAQQFFEGPRNTVDYLGSINETRVIRVSCIHVPLVLVRHVI